MFLAGHACEIALEDETTFYSQGKNNVQMF